MRPEFYVPLRSEVCARVSFLVTRRRMAIAQGPVLIIRVHRKSSARCRRKEFRGSARHPCNNCDQITSPNLFLRLNSEKRWVVAVG